jgi:hypothetical protein
MKSLAASAAALGLALTLLSARETRAEPIPACLTLSGILYLAGDTTVSGDVVRDRIAKQRLDTKGLLALLQSLFPVISSTKGACIRAFPDGSVAVVGEGFEVPVPGILIQYETNDLYNGTFNEANNSQRGMEIFPVSIEIDLLGLQLTLSGLAFESITHGKETDDGLQQKTHTTTIRVFGQGSFSGAPDDVILFQGTVTLRGKGLLPS